MISHYQKASNATQTIQGKILKCRPGSTCFARRFAGLARTQSAKAYAIILRINTSTKWKRKLIALPRVLVDSNRGGSPAFRLRHIRSTWSWSAIVITPEKHRPDQVLKISSLNFQPSYDKFIAMPSLHSDAPAGVEAF